MQAGRLHIFFSFFRSQYNVALCKLGTRPIESFLVIAEHYIFKLKLLIHTDYYKCYSIGALTNQFIIPVRLWRSRRVLTFSFFSNYFSYYLIVNYL